MNLQRIFRTLIAVAWLLQLLSYLLPIPSRYAEPTFGQLMAYDGYGSFFNSDVPLLYTLPLWAFLFATIGLFFFQNWGRYLYLALWVYGWLSTLLFGIRLVLPVQGFLSMALGTLDGAILALVFLTPLRTEFTTGVPPNSPHNTDAGDKAARANCVSKEGGLLHRYKRYGLFGGLGLGVLSGILISGPYFHTWPVATLLYVIVGSSVIGAFMGYMALAIIVGTLIRGSSPDFCALDSGHSFDDQIGHADNSDYGSLGSHGREDSGSAWHD